MSVSVGIITARMLQDAHLTDIGAQEKQSTPSDARAVKKLMQLLLSSPVGGELLITA